jgi:hypothetical protein
MPNGTLADAARALQQYREQNRSPGGTHRTTRTGRACLAAAGSSHPRLDSGCCCATARTVDGYHRRPPRAVATRSEFSLSAIFG